MRDGTIFALGVQPRLLSLPLTTPALGKDPQFANLNLVYTKACSVSRLVAMAAVDKTSDMYAFNSKTEDNSNAAGVTDEQNFP